MFYDAKILEQIKTLCDDKVFDIDFDELKIELGISSHWIYSNHAILHHTLMLANKKDNYCVYVSGSDIDSELFAKYALIQYIKERERFQKRKEEKEKEEKFKKDHPLLSLFKYIIS